jgi:hypothetical protein
MLQTARLNCVPLPSIVLAVQKLFRGSGVSSSLSVSAAVD